MTGGDSAMRHAEELRRRASNLLEMAESYELAGDSERRLDGVLRKLEPLGWSVLADRRWPRRGAANIDFILVGPGGVVIVDAKEWAEPRIDDGCLYRGQDPEQRLVDETADLINLLADELSTIGFVPNAIRAVFAFTKHRIPPCLVGPVWMMGAYDVMTWFAALPRHLEEHEKSTVLSVVEKVCPDKADDHGTKPLGAQRPRPRTVAHDEPLFDYDEFSAELERAHDKPIEDWMTFLDPKQAALVRRSWNGPARIRGPAGTGKTVVGLHRAVYLAQRSSHPVLFTSFVRTLPVVQRALASRISPDAAENIEFTNVHALASWCVNEVGIDVPIDGARIESAFSRAWIRSPARDQLSRIDERPRYWKEEVDYVIKGRGILDFEEYATLKRVGRKTQLKAGAREAAWDLYVEYAAQLSAYDTCDFNDLLMHALDALEENPDLVRYGAAIVDEVQDLTLSALKFIQQVSHGAEYPLLLVGDGQQSVYPGGYTLSEAGIDVPGPRSTVLTTNYRNTAEILETATDVVAADTFIDLEDVTEDGARNIDVVRHGDRPVSETHSSRQVLQDSLIQAISGSRDSGIRLGDMAVLVETRKQVHYYFGMLRQAGLPAVELTDYDGNTIDEVKVGTFKRAKGLDFKHVYMPELPIDAPARWNGEPDGAYLERLERYRREVYVGMTRPRDHLWLGYLDH